LRALLFIACISPGYFDAAAAMVGLAAANGCHDAKELIASRQLAAHPSLELGPAAKPIELDQ
jgi:hypothetical protein